jgi:hypothetical protein
MKHVVFAILIALALAPLGCPTPVSPHAEGLDTSKMPPDIRDAYDLFARRCSKCHTLARPLQSGIDDDAYWAEYVERMRRQPASGISPEDEVIILKFLHYFSVEQRRERAARESFMSPETPAPAAPTADGGT